MKFNKVEIIATILSIIGNIFIIYKSKIGFGIWIAANILWIDFALDRKDKHYWLAGLFLFYTILAIAGLIKW